MNTNKLKRCNDDNQYNDYENNEEHYQNLINNSISTTYLPKRIRSFENYNKSKSKIKININDKNINSNSLNCNDLKSENIERTYSDVYSDLNNDVNLVDEPVEIPVETSVITLSDKKINAIYLLLKNMNEQLSQNKDEIKNLKSELKKVNDENLKLKELNDNINIIKNDTKEIRKDLTTLESVVTNKQLHNENAILNNIKKLSINSEKAEKDEYETTYDYRSSYIN